MRLATIRTPHGLSAARIEDGMAVELDAPDVGALLVTPDWRDRPGGAVHDLSEVDYAPMVPAPAKIFCVGLNYRTHILEMGRELPRYPRDPKVFLEPDQTVVTSIEGLGELRNRCVAEKS